jgi:hypothetical protein
MIERQKLKVYKKFQKQKNIKQTHTIINFNLHQLVSLNNPPSLTCIN